MTKHGATPSEAVPAAPAASDVAEYVRKALEEKFLALKANVASHANCPKGRDSRKGDDETETTSEDGGHPRDHRCGDDDDDVYDDARAREQGILELGEQLKSNGKANELGELIKATRPFLSMMSKAKAAKLVRALVEMFLDMDASTGYEVQLCLECIEWARAEKRIFLRQSLEARLMTLYYDLGLYSDAIALGSRLLRELKKLDDKNLLVEVQLTESKTYHALGNLPKARAALTSARTTANGIYCPPRTQAALDLQSGILHAADERDFKTAYSYFYEAFEGFDSAEDLLKAVTALKYMLMSKIMLKLHDDVPAVLSAKLTLRYAGPDLDAMKKIAKTSRERSLKDFQAAVKEHSTQLEDDPIIRSHLNALYDQMLEQNLLRIIEPYSKVEVDHVSKVIALPQSLVEKKLSQMILDKTLSGVLDQGTGVLVVFDPSPSDKTYEAALDTIQSMEKVVDTLFLKARKLT